MLVLVLMLMGRVEVYNKKSCRGFATAFFVVSSPDMGII